MAQDEQFFKELEEILEEMFPKHKCRERGAALMLFAWANIIHSRILDELKERVEMYPDRLESDI